GQAGGSGGGAQEDAAAPRVRAGRDGARARGPLRRLLRSDRRDQRGPDEAQGARQHLRPGDSRRARLQPGGEALMAKKRVAAIVKIQIPAGNATPAPPVGTALGPHGVNIMDFCKMYNSQTESQRGTIVPVEITVFEDRSFTFVTKTPPTPVLLRAAAGLEKASQTP